MVSLTPRILLKVLKKYEIWMWKYVKIARPCFFIKVSDSSHSTYDFDSLPRSTTSPPKPSNQSKTDRVIVHRNGQLLNAVDFSQLPSLVKLSGHSSSELSNLIKWVCFVGRFAHPCMFRASSWSSHAKSPCSKTDRINPESERNVFSNKCSQKENQREQEVPTFLWLDQGSLEPSHHNQFLHHSKR